MGCDEYTLEALMMWLDDEAGAHTTPIAAHIAGCAACGETVQELRAQHEALNTFVEASLGEVDTLEAIRGIRERIAAAPPSPWQRWRAFWQETWTFQRPKLASLVAAGALGALTAPAVVWWLGHDAAGSMTGTQVASAVVESMEVADDTRAVVYRPEGSSITLIWVEPQDEGDDLEQPNDY